MRAKAAVARAHGAPLVILDLDVDEPRKGEVLVRMIASGVASCDQAAIDGALPMPLPFVPGCEGAGIVERVGEGVTTPAPGEAVLILASNRHALTGVRSDGSAPYAGDAGSVNGFFFGQSSFATHLLCQAELALPVADDAPLELLAGLGCEVLLGAGLMLRNVDSSTDATVVITGADACGLGAVMAAAALGVGTIIVADPREGRRALASALGATVTVPADDGLGAVVKSLVADGASLAFETTGSPAALAGCEASLGADGRCVVASQEKSSLDLAASIPHILAWQAAGRFPLEKLVTYFPFEHVNEALEALRSGVAAKPVLRFSLGSFGDLDRALQEGAAQEEPASDPDDSEDDDKPADAPTEREREAPSVPA